MKSPKEQMIEIITDLNEAEQIKRRESLRAGHAAAREIFKDVETDPRIVAARKEQ